MTKVLIISDLHAGTTSESTNHPGNIRQASNTATTTLRRYIPKFVSEKYDWVINLGDNIRNSSDRNENKRNFEESVKVFGQIPLPRLYITGNHEYKNMTKEDVDKILSDNDVIYEKRGEKQIGKVKYIWIDSVLGDKDLASVSDDTLNWLEKTIKPNDQLVILSHYSLCPIKEKDNFYFGSDPKYMSYTNGDNVLNLLEKCNSAITINGHTHMANFQKHGNVSSISLMAFSENITSMTGNEINPGVYSVLQIDDANKCLKTYSGDFCFLRFEL